MMIGGEKEAVDHLDPIFAALAPGRRRHPAHAGPRGPRSARRAWLHPRRPSGAGHFVKMVHNGIEYGLMQAYAEGFDILRNADSKDLPEDQRFDLNLADIAEVWRRGSVICSWLLDLTAMRAGRGPEAARFPASSQDSGEGRWTIKAAIEEAVPANVLSAALYARFRSREEHTFGDKMLSAMRKGSAATSNGHKRSSRRAPCTEAAEAGRGWRTHSAARQIERRPPC